MGCTSTEKRVAGGEIGSDVPVSDNVNLGKKMKNDNEVVVSAEDRFKGMILKRIVKENHGKPINDLQFNYQTENSHNIFATVGHSQVNIYDNENRFGNDYEEEVDDAGHIDITMQWAGDNKTRVNCVCWVNVPYHDGVFAAGCEDGVVRVMSVAKTAEIAVLEGHAGPVTHLASPLKKDDCVDSTARDVTSNTQLICSVSQRDDSVIIWQLCGIADQNPNQNQADHKPYKCLLKLDVPKPTVAEFYNNAANLLIGTAEGYFYSVDTRIQSLSSDSNPTPTLPQLKKYSFKHKKGIESMKWMGGNSFISQSADNNIVMWDISTQSVLTNITKAGSFMSAKLCPFDVSKSQKFLCVGNHEGQVLIYKLDEANGTCIARLKHPRVKTMQITACKFTNDASQVVCTTESSFIFRFDYVSPQVMALWDEKDRQAEAAAAANDNENNSEHEN